jgi:hypothetical protein
MSAAILLIVAVFLVVAAIEIIVGAGPYDPDAGDDWF